MTATTRRRYRTRPGHFLRLAATITRNARRYRTITACRLAMARVKVAYARAGSYGCEWHEYQAAINALRDRIDMIQQDAWAAEKAREVMGDYHRRTFRLTLNSVMIGGGSGCR